MEETPPKKQRRARGGAYADYVQPKPMDAELTEKERAFIEAMVHKKMSCYEAFDEAGYKCNSARHIARHRARRLQRHLWMHIEYRIKERVNETAALALSVLHDLMTTAESENVKLNAARDVLSRAGYDAVNRSETVFKDVTQLSDKELDEQIAQLTNSNIVKFGKKG